MKIQISPSLLSADFTRLGEKMKELEPFVDSWHFDVMDGHFVPNLSMGLPVLKSIKSEKITKHPIITHLMVDNPEKFIEAFAKAGADVIEFHIEATDNQKTTREVIQKINDAGRIPGMALNPETPVERIVPYLDELDVVLVMSVNPGFEGQKFIDVTDKIKTIREVYKYKGNIEIDGGITGQNAKKAVKAGANILVSGSYIFRSPNPKQTVLDLRKLVS